MNREEKREELLEANLTDSANLYCQAVAEDDCTVMLDQAYQYGLQQGKKEAVERFEELTDYKKVDEWESGMTTKITYNIGERKKEMLEPLSTEEPNE